MSDAESTIRALDCWRSSVEISAISGGITNRNFKVISGGESFFVRLGEDIPEHGVMRFNERTASIAASAAGLSPSVVYSAPGALVLDFIDGKTLGEEDFSDPATISRAIALVRDCHYRIPEFLQGPVLVFWVFQVIRGYSSLLEKTGSRFLNRLNEFRKISAGLEQAVGDIRIVFGHNDLLPANFIDDGDRLWLIDWDYAGFNSPLFDLGGMASNNSLDNELENMMLSCYFGQDVDTDLLSRYHAMKCASLLRESMWSMVSEKHSSIDFDFEAYTDENLERFNRAYSGFQERFNIS